MSRVRTEDRAYVSNYPPLREWLEKHEARCMWQEGTGPKDNPDFVECWIVNGVAMIVVVHANRRGWDIFTPCRDSSIEATLTDAELRCGIGGV